MYPVFVPNLTSLISKRRYRRKVRLKKNQTSHLGNLFITLFNTWWNNGGLYLHNNIIYNNDCVSFPDNKMWGTERIVWNSDLHDYIISFVYFIQFNLNNARREHETAGRTLSFHPFLTSAHINIFYTTSKLPFLFFYPDQKPIIYIFSRWSGLFMRMEYYTKLDMNLIVSIDYYPNLMKEYFHYNKQFLKVC